jgi:hypothetical protein
MMCSFFDIPNLLQQILKEIKSMATTLVQLDAALATLSTEVATIVTDVQALVAKLNAGADYTNELATVNTDLSTLQGADAAAQAVLSPPPAPSA